MAKPSSSTCGHDTACCVAAVPHKRSSAKGSANDFDEIKPGCPRDICQAISLEAKVLAKIYVVADDIETIKVKLYRYLGGGARLTSPIVNLNAFNTNWELGSADATAKSRSVPHLMQASGFSGSCREETGEKKS